MAGFRFEGELESLTERQKEFVSEVLKNRDLNVKKVIIETVGKAGDNYVANVKKITAELENGEKLKMIAKIAPTNETLRNNMGTVILFGNECTIYNDIFPKFVELQQAAGLTKEESFRFPECYGTLAEPLNEIILLEDLKDSNFEMLDRFVPLSNESVKEVLKNFAKLHSLSFALKNKDPDSLESYRKRLADFFGFLVTNEDFRAYLSGVEAKTLSTMDDDHYKEYIRNSISQMPEQIMKITKSENVSKYLVVTHGDGWTNNFMFRLKDNVPKEAILIDYQLSKVGSPVRDLLYMIFSSTDHGTRVQHYFEWIDFYHSELDNCLSNFGLKAINVYPRDQLDADLLTYSRVFFSTSIMLITVLIRSTEEAAKMKESMESATDGLDFMLETANQDIKHISLFKSKVEGLVDSYRRLGYLV